MGGDHKTQIKVDTKTPPTETNSPFFKLLNDKT